MAVKKKNVSKSFVFKAYANIGEPGAEDDDAFLEDCFVHTDALDVLLDTSNPKRIVLGRTGTGKSALLSHIKRNNDLCIEIEPNELALGYIANSTILQFFESLGVKLDIFYRLLWRHVLVVSLLQDKYSIVNEGAKGKLSSKLSDIFTRDKTKKVAVEYLDEWGSKFWLETESRVKEVTTKLEKSLTAGTDISSLGIPLTIASAKDLSLEEKEELVNKAQKVVDEIQIQALAKVFNLLDEDIFTDSKKPYYILIDRLDEDWVADKIRYKLIRALIETIKSFKKVHNVKVIVALRRDLLSRVIQETRDHGFQEDKYESLFLNLKWTRPQLQEILDSRLNYLIKNQYTNATVKLLDIVPPKMIEQNFMDYLLDRTLMRPRDVIMFMNECLAGAVGQAKSTVSMVRDAEAEYSTKRLRSLFDDWNADYPCIVEYYKLLQNKEPHFKLNKFSKDDVEDFIINLTAEDNTEDPLILLANRYISESKNIEWFLARWCKIIFRIGLIGIKPDAESSKIWNYMSKPAISERQITFDSVIYVHPMFWRGLGIHAKNSKRFITNM